MGPTQTARCSLLAAAIAVTWAAGATLAPAQTTPPGGAAAETTTVTGGLQEVTVTANRRVESQQTVPIATSTITGEQMQAVGITDINQLGNNIAGAVFNRQANGSIPFIRGVGNPNTTAGDEPSVATYVDDVYIASTDAGIFNYNNIDRIEVDKGPQGTLFGRNATGGVIQIHTKDPTFTPEYIATVGAANFQTYSASMYASGGLSQTVAANFSAYWQGQYGGWGHNAVTGNPSYTEHDAGGRVKVLWTPSDQTSVLLNLDHDWTWYQQGMDYRAAPGTDSEGGFPGPGGYYDYYSPFDDYGTLNTSGASVKVNQGFGWSNLVSITAFRYAHAPAFYNLGLGPIIGPPPSGIFSVEPVRPIDNDDQSFTQELRLESPATSSNVKWILGFYYFHDIASYDPLNIDIPAAMQDLNYVATQHTNSYALFGDTTLAVTSATHVTVGLRGTTSNRNAHDSFMVNGMPVPTAYGSGSARFNSLTGRFIVDHRFSDDFMAYVAYNRGYKDGLFNLAAVGTPITSEACTPANACAAPVKPETLDDLSIGQKAEFFDHRLRVNTEAFYYWYKNLQVQEVVNDASLTTNAARAVIKGVDLDITAKPVEDLLVVGSFSYLDGYFTDFPNGDYNVYQPNGGGDCAFASNNTCGLPPGSPFLPPRWDPATGTWNLAGNRTPNSPVFSMSLNLYYTKQTNIGALDANLAWHHSQMYFFQADNGRGQQPPSSPSFAAQPVLNLFDGSLGWTALNGKWEVRLWGRNLSNVKYSDFTFETAPATQISAAPPRQYGITFTAHLK